MTSEPLFEEQLDALSRAAATPLDPTQQQEYRDDLGALHIERYINNVGLLCFFAADIGQWLTQKGEPAKKAKSNYTLHPLDAEPFELDRVSSIPDCLHKPALLRWYEDHGARGAIKAHALGELDEVPEEEIIERVRLLELGAESQRDAAAVRGTGVHNILERLAKGQSVTRDFLPAGAQPWYAGATAAWIALDPQPPFEIEQIVCHPEDRYAGRPDLTAMVDGTLTLIDYKTGRGQVYAEAHYQTRLYERARRRCGFEPCERIIIVGVDAQGGYTLSEGLVGDDEAETLLALYRSKQRVDKALAVQRRAA